MLKVVTRLRKPLEEMTAEELREYVLKLEHECDMRGDDQMHLMHSAMDLQAQIAEFEEMTQSLSEKLAKAQDTIEWQVKLLDKRIAAMEEFHEKEIAELKAELSEEIERRRIAEKEVAELHGDVELWMDRYDALTQKQEFAG